VRRAGFSVLALAAVFAVVAVPEVSQATPVVPTVHPVMFARHPAGASKPDDITRLGDLLYITYQNDAGKDGTPAGSFSTVIAYDSTGRTVAKYTIPGRCDGLTADPRNNRVLATANEDLNSSLFVIHPGTSAPVHYTYSPDPAQHGSDGKNGGTDSISVAANGKVYVAHSNPDPKLPAPNNAPAVYPLKLTGSTAQLTPVFRVNDPATVINAATAAAKPMGLTDPDSNEFLPNLHGGTLIQGAQGDSKLVFATNLNAALPTLKQLDLTNATPPKHGAATPQLDDLAQVTGPGTLYVVDQGPSAWIYAINTADIAPGTVFASQPNPSKGDLPNDPSLAVVDLKTGAVTHVRTPLTSPKGLLFVPAAAKTTTSLAGMPSTSSSNAPLLYGAGFIVVILGAGFALLMWRRQRPSVTRSRTAQRPL